MLQNQRGENEVEPLLLEPCPIVIQSFDLYGRQVSATRDHRGDVEAHDSPRNGGQVRKIPPDPAPEIQYSIERGG